MKKIRLPQGGARRPAHHAMTRGDLILAVTFAIVTGAIVAPYIVFPWAFGGDARVYAEGARLWLTGGNPWGVQPGTAVTFAAPPHALLFFAPFAFLPPVVTGTGWTLFLLLVSVAAIRRLGLPMWWLAFPPLSSAIVVGSLDALVFALLVLGPGWLAPVAKPYAIFPLIAERRFAAAAISVGISIAALVVLPWRLFLDQLGQIGSDLGLHAQDLSAFGEPIGMVVGIVALASLGWRRALWVVTPVLWPSTQLHYAAMTIPALTVVIAFFFALPVAGAPVIGVLIAAVVARIAPTLDPPVRADWSKGPTRGITG